MSNTLPSCSWALPLAATLVAQLASTTLRAQAAARPPIQVRAHVVDVDGAPIESAAFLYSRADTITTQQALKTPTATTDEKGLLSHTIPSGPDEGAHDALITATGKTSVRVRLTGRMKGLGEKRRRLVDLGLIVLRKGVTIRGLVRSKQGKPIPGARVRATDVFRTRHLSLHIDESCISWATTDEKGKFALAGVPDRGASVRITAPGYHDFDVQYASKFTPVVAHLTAGGTAKGIVVDAADEPASGIVVRANFEQSEVSYTVITDAKGRFAVPLRVSGRYRLQAHFEDPAGSRDHWSGVLTGPQSAVRMQLPADRIVAANTGLRIRVRARTSGKTITEFMGAVVWVDPKSLKRNKEQLSKAFDRSARSSDARGELVLPGPSEKQPDTGRVLVKARGYASTFVDVEADGAVRVEVEMQLDPEAVFEGTVVDQKTGEPLEGTKVRIMPNEHGQQIVETDARGRFRATGLSRGMHSIVVSDPDRPDTSPQAFKLSTGQIRRDFEVKVPRGITCSGRLYGAKIGAGWRVKLDRKVVQRFDVFPISRKFGGPGSKGTVLVAADGRFQFTGVTKGMYQLTLHIPYSQGTVEIVVRTVNVRGDATEKLDISAVFPPARLRGSVETSGASLPPGRLLVVAHSSAPAAQRGGWPLTLPITPASHSPRALVDPAGAYDLPLRSGKYVITLVDLATGIEVFRSKTLTIEKRASRQFDITTALATVICQLTPEEPGQPVLAHRVEAVVHQAKPAPVQRGGFLIATGTAYDSGKGLALPSGRTEFTIVLPAASTTLRVRSAAHMLDPKKSMFTLQPIGTMKLTPEAEKINRIQIKVTAPDIELPRSN